MSVALRLNENLLDRGEKDEGSNGEATTRDNDTSNSRRDEEEGGDDDHSIDKGPIILSVDQSAITGESLAVDKCTFFSPRSYVGIYTWVHRHR